MLAHRQAAGVARRIAALVVEPKGHAPPLRLLHHAYKRRPLGLVLQVLVERIVDYHAAKALHRESIEELVLGGVDQRHVVRDLQNAKPRRRMGERRVASRPRFGGRHGDEVVQ